MQVRFIKTYQYQVMNTGMLSVNS